MWLPRLCCTADLYRDEADVWYSSRIQLEITETALINNMAAANRLVTEMRSAGCTVALDDFGAGAAAFSYLRELTVDYVKIDGAYVMISAKREDDRLRFSVFNTRTETRHALVCKHADALEAEAEAAFAPRLSAACRRAKRAAS